MGPGATTGNRWCNLPHGTSLPKTAQLRRDPRMCTYYHLPDEFRGLTIKGRARFVEEMDAKETVWQKGRGMYYPQGAQDPDFTVFSVEPVRAHYYHQLEFAVIECPPRVEP